MAWCIQWTLATFFFVLVMAGAGYYVFMEALDGGQYVTVPSIEGMPITKASLLLAEQGLELGKPTQVPHPSVPKDHVITQRPAAGRVVRTGRKVYPTTSTGADFLRAPDLLNKTLEDARRELAQSHFRMGTVARIPHRSVRDTVLAQDPPPNAELPNQGSIHLLASAGDERQGVFMPDIRGMRVESVLDILSPLGVFVAPNEVDTPGAPTDVVLNQTPPPNALVQEGQIVSYDVKPSGAVDLPDARYEAEVRHQMAFEFAEGDVRVDLLDRQGNRRKVWPLEEQPLRRYAAGSVIRIPVTYVEEATVEVYYRNNLVESYYLAGGAEPVQRRSTF